MAEKSNNDNLKTTPTLSAISGLTDHERENIRIMARNNSRRPRKLSAKGRYLVVPQDSIKCIAEQTQDDDTEISPEVYERLSEDVTYRLYEMIGNLKTFATHSNGVVTGDIVNEVLATSFVPPILGKGELKCQRLGDGEHLIEKDPDIFILKELLKDLKIEEPGRFAMRVTPYVLPEDVGTLQSFYTKISRAVLSGTKLQFQYSVYQLRTNTKYDAMVSNFLTLAILVLNQYSNDNANKKPASRVQRNRLLLRRTLLMVQAIANNKEFTELSNLKIQITHLVHQLLRILLQKITFAGLNINTKKSTTRKIKRKKLKKKAGISLIKSELEGIIKNETASGQEAIDIKMEEDAKNPPNITEASGSNVQDNKAIEIVERPQEIIGRESLICNVLSAIARRWEFANILILNLVDNAFFKERTSTVHEQGFILALKILTCGGILGHATFWSVVTSKTFKSLSQDTIGLLIKAAVKFYIYFPFFEDVNDIDRWLYEILGDAIVPFRSGQLEYQEEPDRSSFEPEVIQREKPYKFISLALNNYKNKRNDYFDSYNEVVSTCPLKIVINLDESVQREIKMKKRFQFEPLYYNNERANNHLLIRRQLWNFTSYRNTYKYNLQAFHL